MLRWCNTLIASDVFSYSVFVRNMLVEDRLPDFCYVNIFLMECLSLDMNAFGLGLLKLDIKMASHISNELFSRHSSMFRPGVTRLY